MSRGICQIGCWAVAALIGIALGSVAGSTAGLGFFVGVVIAIMATLGLGWALPAMICPSARAPAAARAVKPAATAAPQPKPAAAPEAAGAASGAASASGGHWSSSVASESGAAGEAQGQSGLQPTATLSEEASLRDGVGSWRYEGDAPAAKPAASAPAATGGVRPAALTAARAGGADDLKKIKGVGPKLEELLNSLGFYHFDQIAGWTADEVAWVDENLEGFKGRVSRDEWVAQAKLLAEGGETEFSKKVDKGDVY
ncbi:MAG: endonuclease [Pseudomonadota bacterium]